MSRWISLPVWTGTEPTPRVVVEVADPAKRHAIERILTDHGYAVRTCPGPEGDDVRCPVADGQHCLGVMGGDVVVHALRQSDPRNRAVLLALQRRYPDVPIVVEAPAPWVARHGEDFEACHLIPQPMTAATLLGAVGAVLTGQPGSDRLAPG